jgi:uncharacterized protein (DUF433 family)
MSVVTISEPTFRLLQQKARQRAETPDQVADELLLQQLTSKHPYIEVVSKPTGDQAMIKGTRVPVSTVVSYLRIGETPESLTQEIIPHLTLAQIYDALSYFHDHSYEVEQEISQNSEEWGRAYLREHLGEEDYLRLTGQAR